MSTPPLTADCYAPCLHEDFVVTASDGRTVVFKLTEVRNLAHDEMQIAFSLFFTCADLALPQQTYRVSHARLGEFDLGLVPVRRQRGDIAYQAAFNRLKDDTP